MNKNRFSLTSLISIFSIMLVMQSSLIASQYVICSVQDDISFEKVDFRTLEDVKVLKKQEITKAFNEEIVKAVDVNGVLYHGGFDSALKLDGAKRISESAGATEVTFFDTSNKGAILSIGAATNVIAKIGAKYQIDFAKFEGLKVELEGKQKVSTVESMRW